MIDLYANASGSIVATLKNANSGGVAERVRSLSRLAIYGSNPEHLGITKLTLEKRKIDNITIGDREFSTEAVANITYGYIGRASGFSAKTLYMGAGGAQRLVICFIVVVYIRRMLQVLFQPLY